MNSRRTKTLLIGVATLVLALLTTLALRYAWTGEPDGGTAISARPTAPAPTAVAARPVTQVAATASPAPADVACPACSGRTTRTTDDSGSPTAGAIALAGASDSPAEASRRTSCSRGTEADVVAGTNAAWARQHTPAPASGGGSRVSDAPNATGSLATRTFKLLPYDPTTW